MKFPVTVRQIQVKFTVISSQKNTNDISRLIDKRVYCSCVLAVGSNKQIFKRLG